MKKIIVLSLLTFIFMPLAQAKHLYYEADYQNAHCSQVGGVTEYQNSDYTRVDCLTDKYAIEYDFAKKWAECVGQSLHYQLMTGKIGKCVLILENPQKEMVYYNRVKALAEKHGFQCEYITPDIMKSKGK